VILEREILADDHDVIAGVAGSRANPDRREALVRVLTQKRGSEDMTRAAGKEHTVRKRPLLHRIALRAFGAPHLHRGRDSIVSPVPGMRRGYRPK
jgi:hypothetical protein